MVTTKKLFKYLSQSSFYETLIEKQKRHMLVLILV